MNDETKFNITGIVLVFLILAFFITALVYNNIKDFEYRKSLPRCPQCGAIAEK